MQPERDTSDTPQSTPQPASFAASPSPQEPARTPVVTLAPDTPAIMPQPIAPSPQPVQVNQNATVVDEPEAPTQPAAATVAPAQDIEPLRWQATEYIHHEKDALWFVVFAAVVIAMMVFSILVIQSVTFTVLIPVMAAALVVYTRRPPRMIDYTLSSQGLHLNDQLYPFSDFKGFGVIRDGQEYSIMLLPTKRFKLGVSVYFPEEAGEAIVDVLGTRLPMQEMHLDAFDRIIHKLRI